MSSDAQAADAQVSPTVEAAPVAVPADVAAAVAAAKPPDGKEPESAKAPETKDEPKVDTKAWDKAVKAERKAREAVAAADKRAKAAEDAASAARADIEAKAKEIAPILDMIKRKDAKGLMALGGLSMIDVANLVAEEGKAPTLDEIKAAAVAEATGAFEAAQAKRDEAAAAAKKKADEAAAVERQTERDAKFVAAVQSTTERVESALNDPANAETLADALDADAFFEATDPGETPVQLGDLSVVIKGGTVVSREATKLILKVLDESNNKTLLAPVEALKLVQAKLSGALQKTAERRTGTATKPQKQTEQKKNGGDAKPTLSTRATNSATVEPKEDDGGSVVDEASVRRTMKSIPSLRHLVAAD